jgi:hypothetical protein
LPPRRSRTDRAAVAVAFALLVASCGPCSNGSDVETAISELRSTDADVRYEAIVRLGSLAPTTARRRALVGALADADPKVRLMAAIVVVGDGAATPAAPPATTPSTSARPPTPNPSKATPLTPVEQIVAADPWFAGTLLPAALLAVESADERVRALGHRALDQLKAMGELDGPTLRPEPLKPK